MADSNETPMPSADAVLPRPLVYRSDLLAGQTALVSGGGTGIGQATALLLARLGADVAICGRRPEPLDATRSLIADATDAECLAVPTNIREPDQVDALYERIHDGLGALDLVVNNAGGQYPGHSIDLSDKGWRAVVDTNLNGTWTMMQRAARHWRAAERGGAIVNVIAPYIRGMYGIAHTVAARAGVAYLSRNVAVEWAPLGIRVNCVLPAGIATEGLQTYAPEVRAEMAANHPLRMLGDAQDVAEAVVYLAAPSGRFITGETVTLDGGHQIHGDLWQAGRPEGWENPND